MLYFSGWHLEVSSPPDPFSSFTDFSLSGTPRPLAFSKYIMLALFFPKTAKEMIWPFITIWNPELPLHGSDVWDFLSSCQEISSLAWWEWSWEIVGAYLISLPQEKMLREGLLIVQTSPAKGNCEEEMGERRESIGLQGHSELCWHFISLTSVQRIPGCCPEGWKGEDGHSQKTKMEKIDWPSSQKGQSEFPHGKGQVSVSLQLRNRSIANICSLELSLHLIRIRSTWILGVDCQDCHISSSCCARALCNETLLLLLSRGGAYFSTFKSALDFMTSFLANGTLWSDIASVLCLSLKRLYTLYSFSLGNLPGCHMNNLG